MCVCVCVSVSVFVFGSVRRGERRTCAAAADALLDRALLSAMARTGAVERVRFTSGDDDEEAASLASVGVRASSAAGLAELEAAVGEAVLLERRTPAMYSVEWLVPASRAPRHDGVHAGGLAWCQHAGRIVWSEGRGGDRVLRSLDASAAAGAEPGVGHLHCGGGGGAPSALVPHAGGALLLGGSAGLSLAPFAAGGDVFGTALGTDFDVLDAVADTGGGLLLLLAPGRLARVSAAAPRTPVALDDDCGGCVAVCASRDGAAVYVSNAAARRVVGYRRGPDGALHGKRTALSCAAVHAGGEPWGLAMDAAGCVWVALRGAWRVVRFSPADSAVLAVVAVPVRCPVRVAFGGPMLNDVYVLAAPEGRSGGGGGGGTAESMEEGEEPVAERPQCVSVFRVRIAGVRGAWAHVAAGFDGPAAGGVAPPALCPGSEDDE